MESVGKSSGETQEEQKREDGKNSRKAMQLERKEPTVAGGFRWEEQ